MNKKILFSIILGLILISMIGGYFVFYKSGPVAPNPESTDIAVTLPGGTTKTLSETGPISLQLSTNQGLKSVKNLNQLTNKMVGGATYNNYNISTSSDVMFVEKTTGYVYAVNTDATELKRLTNTLIPKISNVWWGKKNNKPNLIIKYTDKNEAVRWFNSTIEEIDSGEGQLIGSDLSLDIFSLAVSPNKDNIVYLKKVNQNVIAEVLNLSSGKKTNIFNSNFKDWNINWDSSSSIELNSKPSGGVAGILMSLNPNTNQPKTLLEGVNGLTTLVSPQGNKILVSSGGATSIYNQAQKSSELLNINTFPEKCTWSNDNLHVFCGVPNQLPTSLYPDNWYSGEVSFSDSIIKINTETGTTTLLINPTAENNNTQIDMINPFLVQNESALIFTNKQDLTLWALDLTK